MAITIQLPREIEDSLRREIPNLDEATQEWFILANYQAGKFSAGDVAHILGFSTRQDVYAWLKDHGVPVNYTATDLADDRDSFRQLVAKG
jgi:hypothetical protein